MSTGWASLMGLWAGLSQRALISRSAVRLSQEFVFFPPALLERGGVRS